MFLEMGLYRSRIEFLVMFEVISEVMNSKKIKKGGSTNRVPMKGSGQNT